MNAFLKDAQKRLQLMEPLTIVIGNESCDIDSVVCAIALAYFYESVANRSICMDGKRTIIPVMNLSRENFPLKTEVVFFMHKHGIDIDNLICCDEIPRQIYEDAKFILVDHHVPKSPVLMANVIEVIDHRPLDVNASFPVECKVNICEVGSCATLVADVIRTASIPESLTSYYDSLQLLQGAIILDTVNFSISAGKARPLDFEIMAAIEKIIPFNENQRKTLFSELVKARSNVDSLTALQLLSKDLKIITSINNIAIPGFPILVQEYARKPNAWEAVNIFANMHRCDAIILMGMKEEHIGSIRRDIAILSLSNPTLSQQILQKILDCENPSFKLQAKKMFSEDFEGIHTYEQQNVKASRKQIVPLIMEILDNNANNM